MSDWEEISPQDEWEEIDHSEIISPPKKESKHSGGMTALEHFGKGATLGYLPQLQAAAETATDAIGRGKDKLLDAIGLDDLASTDYQLEKQGFKLPKDGYVEKRDQNIRRQREQAEENPITAGVANVAGGVTTGIASAPLLGATNAATLPGRLAQAAKIGAGYGAAANPGDIEGELSPLQIKQRAVNAAIGAGTGAAAQGLVEGASALAKPVSENARKAALWLKQKAEERAVKALGGSKKAIESLKATPGAESRLGRNLLDEGVVTPFANKAKMADRLDDLAAGRIDDLTGEINRVSELQSKVTPENALRLEASKFSPRDAAEQLKQELREQYSHIPEDILEPQFQVIDKWFSRPGRMDIKDVQAFKTQMQKFIKDGSYLKSNPGLAQETLKGIRRSLKTGIEQNADEAAAVLGERGGKLKSINQDLGGLFQGQDMVEDAIARGAKNRTVSLTDYITGNAGAAAMGPKGMALGLVNKVAREKGSQVSAVAADRVSKYLMKIPRFEQLSRSNPQAFNALAADMAQKMRPPAGDIVKIAEGSYEPNQEVPPEEARNRFLGGN